MFIIEEADKSLVEELTKEATGSDGQVSLAYLIDKLELLKKVIQADNGEHIEILFSKSEASRLVTLGSTIMKSKYMTDDKKRAIFLLKELSDESR